jgi:hypothetical protein
MRARPVRPFAILERVDRLELRVCDGGLDQNQRWEVVAVAELGEVGEQSCQVLGRWRHEVRAAGVVVVAADPVLDVPNPPGDGCVRGSAHEGLVDVDQIIHRDRRRGGRLVDRQFHGVDVGENLGGRPRHRGSNVCSFSSRCGCTLVTWPRRVRRRTAKWVGPPAGRHAKLRCQVIAALGRVPAPSLAQLASARPDLPLDAARRQGDL